MTEPARPDARPDWDPERIAAVYAAGLSAAAGPDTDFFAAGGHSLLAVLLADRLRELLRVPVTGFDVMEHPTPRALLAELRGRTAPPHPAPGAAGAGAGAATSGRGTVLVTGGTGAVGSFVVAELLARGHRVRALVRPESAAALAGTGAEPVDGDLAEPDGLRAAARGADAVVHAACTFTRPDVDEAALRALADGWEGGPFVFVSSVDAYGRPARPTVREGQGAEGAVSDYGRGKERCESLLLDAADRRSARDGVSLVRVPLVWGPHRRLGEQLRFGALRTFHQRALRGEPLLVPEGHGWTGVPWVGAAALARALADMLDRPAGGTVNAVAGHVGWAELAGELAALMGGGSAVRTAPDLPPALHRPWRYRTDLFDARYGTGLREDWRPLLAATLAAGAGHG
ncbi:NAD-dependent epimerase/dehydratase family protein [Kitasatospora sp. NPDC092039]|uniref:NAD-dependent epimerase/dehydratase family protein n=1 Tax=Kitasatospora sp. NPDC092039 TaxID=3364086 RepID=UPI00381EFC11